MARDTGIYKHDFRGDSVWWARAPISSIINCPFGLRGSSITLTGDILTPLALLPLQIAIFALYRPIYTVVGDIGSNHEIAILSVPQQSIYVCELSICNISICMDMYTCVQEWIMYVHIRNLIYICWMLNKWLDFDLTWGWLRLVCKPRFLMSGTLIFGNKTNKSSSTHSKLCTC